MSKTSGKHGQIDKAFAIKLVSSIIQIPGYTATGFQLHPWNAYTFIVGLIGWFIVGVLWNDRAIMLIHLVAFSALLSGIVA